MSTEALLEMIRGLSEGDEIVVTFGREYTEKRHRTFVVKSTTSGGRPLVDLNAEFQDQQGGTITLEYDEHYSEGTPYNLRWLSSDYDGESVYAVEESN